MLDLSDLTSLVRDQLWPGWKDERERLDVIDAWYRWHHEKVPMPKHATPEHRALADLSRTPWLGLVVTTVAQCMYVDGYRSAVDGSHAADADPEAPLREAIEGPWRTWQANRFSHRQIAVHRAMLAYGQSFVTVLPGQDARGRSTSVMRGVSPRKMFVLYDDPEQDDWPEYAMRLVRGGGDTGTSRIQVYDEEAVYTVELDPTGTDPARLVEEPLLHESDVCPVVRYSNLLDLDGRSPGEVEPFIPAAKRINKTAYDRLLIQHFASWKVRTVAGMSEPDSEEEAVRKKLQLKIEDILVAEDPDTKFGTLDSTPVEGMIESWRADIEALAAVTQTPTHALTGQLVNLSAEALAAARASLNQKVTERQMGSGESHLQALHLAAEQQGDYEYADDVSARVTWRDMEIRSMSQAVDALGKAAQMLQVPVEALWARIPGVEKADVDEWIRLAQDSPTDVVAQYTRELERQAADEIPALPPGQSDAA